MATAFRATSKGYRADLDAHERRLISALCADVIEILQARTDELNDTSSDDDGGSVHPPLTAAGEPPTGGETSAQSPGEGERSSDPQGLMEDSVFAHFSAELAGLDEDVPVASPEDPVLRRLLPDASGDEEEAAQLRRLSEGSLRESKTSDLRTARMLLERSPLAVPDDQAPVLGRALNDVRLTLSARLDIEEESDADRVHRMAVSGRAKSAESFMAEVYTFVTWLQETLFSAMLQHLPEEGREREEQDPNGPHGDSQAGDAPDGDETGTDAS